MLHTQLAHTQAGDQDVGTGGRPEVNNPKKREGEAHFTRVVRRHEAPQEVPELSLPDGDPVHLPALLVAGLGVGSTSEARRLIEQGGVKVNGEPVATLDLARGALSGALLQVGKRRFARLTA